MELGKTEDRQTALDTFVAEGGTYLVIHQGQSSRVSATRDSSEDRTKTQIQAFFKVSIFLSCNDCLKRKT